MAVSLTMPKLTQTMDEGSIVEWLKKEGEPVDKGEPVFVVETDKAAIEFESPVKGVLGKILLEPNVTVPVGQPVGVVVAPGESVPETTPSSAAQEIAKPAEGAPQRAASVPETETREAGTREARTGAVAPTDAREPGPAVSSPTADTRPGRIKASPLARRLAAEMRVDLARVRGTGPGGRVVRDDVIAATRAPAPAPAAAAPAAPSPATAKAPHPAPPAETAVRPAVESELVPVRGIRKAIAEGMALSARTVARVTLVSEVDASELIRLRAELLPVIEQRTGARLSHTHSLIKLTARVLRDHPRINAHWTEEGIRQWHVAHIGIAVALEEGLVVPVLRNAHEKPLSQIAVEATALAQRARERKLHQDEFSGATFTISNLGMYDIDAFTPIVNVPEAGILGVGRIVDKPVVRDGAIVVRPVVTLSLAFDHRVIDGAQASEFLRDLKRLIEQPYRFLV